MAAWVVEDVRGWVEVRVRNSGSADVSLMNAEGRRGRTTIINKGGAGGGMGGRRW